MMHSDYTTTTLPVSLISGLSSHADLLDEARLLVQVLQDACNEDMSKHYLCELIKNKLQDANRIRLAE
jgi:hypothetical protein